MSLYIPVGRIRSAHGIKGEVKFQYYNEVYEDFLKYTSLYHDEKGEKSRLTLKRVRIRGSTFILQFEEIKDRDSAEKLKGKVLYVREEDLPELEEGEYYIYQIMDMEVKNERGDLLGRVKEVINTGTHHVLDVVGKREVLIPMVEGFIISVDLKSKELIVREPEYL